MTCTLNNKEDFDDHRENDHGEYRPGSDYNIHNDQNHDDILHDNVMVAVNIAASNHSHMRLWTVQAKHAHSLTVNSSFRIIYLSTVL